jgi:hypothetical protein
VYAIVQFKTGKCKFVVLSVDEVEEIRECSNAKDGDAWKKWWGEMAKKTGLHRLFKYIPLSPEIKRATLLDDSTNGGVRPGEGGSDDGRFDGITADTSALQARLSAVADEPAETVSDEPPPPSDPPAAYPPCDGDGVVDAVVVEEPEVHGVEEAPPTPVEAFEPTDPRVFGDESKFTQTFCEKRTQFAELVRTIGLSEEEALARWNVKVMSLLGGEGCSTIGELDQKGKNQIIKSLSAAITDYQAALNEKEA